MENPVNRIDKLEIIVTTRSQQGKAKRVSFSEIYPIKDDIETIMFLWNSNSYYVSVKDKTFIVNGGRRLHINDIGKCKLLSRKRNQLTLSTTGDEGKEQKIFWLVGVESEDKVCYLKISEDGKVYEWCNTL